MLSKLHRITGIVLYIVAAALQPLSIQTALADTSPQGNLFVKQAGPQLRLNGKVFRFAGSNNYYLMYKSQFMVDDVLSTAAANHFTVMRMSGSLEIGNQDGSNSIRGKADGVYFQYWNGSAPAYNDGADGLKHLDYALYKAGQLGIKLVIPFVNNWNDFGGMDQYVRWRGGQYHDQFYTDPTIRTWYKNWIAHLLNRTNTYTGIQYKNDPTIMTWELANEPRCLSGGAYPRSGNCTTQTLVEWANDVSTFVKTIDENHLVSVGDEGFYCVPGATDWTENCGEGVDTLAFTRLPNIDVMSLHLYPDNWGKDIAWGTQWIQRHIQDAQKLNKPIMLGEFGLVDKSMRNPAYRQWTDAFFNMGGNGALYWILSGRQDDGSYYADYDGFTVYCPSPVCITISNFAQMMTANQALVFPPVADNDSATTEFDTLVTLNPPANDTTYGGATLVPGSIDLDPATAGQQTTRSVYGGTFSLQPNGQVSFTPTSGFSGKSQVAYTIQDSVGRVSNQASIVVTVKPNPAGVLTLFSFETGTEGWASASWQTNAGTVAQSPNFHTDGSYSLQVTTADGGWFGVVNAAPLDLTGKTHLKMDIQTTNAGTSQNVALQLGDGWTWCQGNWGWINAGTTTTVDIDLTSLNCASPALGKVQSIYVWFSGGGTFYLDDVRAQ
jgi:mannan endo-1,4-beta-mannosidase